MTRRREPNDEDILDRLNVTDAWSKSSLDTPIDASYIEDETAWSAFQRKAARDAQSTQFPASAYRMVHEVALKPRGRRPDVLVLEGTEPVAAIEAKDRRRLDKPDVVGAIKKYEKDKPGSDFRLLIYVPDGCHVSQPALDHATANRIDIVRIRFTLNRKRRSAAGQRRAKGRANSSFSEKPGKTRLSAT
jgi:hypothetical protein